MNQAVWNPFRIGCTSVGEIEDRISSFRRMNMANKKIRRLFAREEIIDPSGNLLVKSGHAIDTDVYRRMCDSFQPDELIRTFQYDEGIVFVTGTKDAPFAGENLSLSEEIRDLLTDNYNVHIDRVERVDDLCMLYKSLIFPRMVILGKMTRSQFAGEQTPFHKLMKIDRYARILIVDSGVQIDYTGLCESGCNVNVINDDQMKAGLFRQNVIRIYTSPYKNVAFRD